MTDLTNMGLADGTHLRTRPTDDGMGLVVELVKPGPAVTMDGRNVITTELSHGSVRHLRDVLNAWLAEPVILPEVTCPDCRQGIIGAHADGCSLKPLNSVCWCPQPGGLLIATGCPVHGHIPVKTVIELPMPDDYPGHNVMCTIRDHGGVCDCRWPACTCPADEPMHLSGCPWVEAQP